MSFCFLVPRIPSEKGSTTKGKNLTPVEAFFFLLTYIKILSRRKARTVAASPKCINSVVLAGQQHFLLDCISATKTQTNLRMRAI